ncbi:MAG: HIT family protein [Bacteroidales bacterium]|jgi:histidine triad (HIT) family protein
MSSIFSKIIQGEIPCYKVAEDENCFAFLDINPLSEGHTLVVPKKEIDYYFDLDDELFTGMNLFAKKLAGAIDKSVDCERVGVAVIGLEVAHAHIHLVPLKNIGDLNFANPKLQLSKERFVEIAEKIASNL